VSIRDDRDGPLHYVARVLPADELNVAPLGWRELSNARRYVVLRILSTDPMNTGRTFGASRSRRRSKCANPTPILCCTNLTIELQPCATRCGSHCLVQAPPRMVEQRSTLPRDGCSTGTSGGKYGCSSTFHIVARRAFLFLLSEEGQPMKGKLYLAIPYFGY
jgi:hypothetical protein